MHFLQCNLFVELASKNLGFIQVIIGNVQVGAINNRKEGFSPLGLFQAPNSDDHLPGCWLLLEGAWDKVFWNWGVSQSWYFFQFLTKSPAVRGRTVVQKHTYLTVRRKKLKDKMFAHLFTVQVVSVSKTVNQKKSLERLLNNTSPIFMAGCSMYW